MTQSVLHLSWHDIERYTAEVVRNMITAQWIPDYIVGINRGGLCPSVMISHYFQLPHYTLDVRLRDGDNDGGESNLWMPEDVVGGTNILLVDDIVDAGNTLSWIHSDWCESTPGVDAHWGTRIKTAALIHNVSCGMDVDFAGVEINKLEFDQWIVFPWESFWNKPVN